MTIGPDGAQTRASKEATDWLIRLQDEPDNLDLGRRFDAWLAADPRNVTAWAATRRTAGMLARIPPRYADRWVPVVTTSRAGESAIASSPTSAGRSSARLSVRRKRGLQLGLGLAAIAACVTFLVAPAALLHLRADYTTGTAQIRTIGLVDGSTVVLAPDSAISVAYRRRERRVRLLAGEAFFTVKHDPGRPFRVAAGAIETTDVGTAFDVRRGDAGATIAVQQGGVHVDNSGMVPPVSETLTAGQSVRIAWTGETIRDSAPPMWVAAWRQNQLIAQDRPMREIVDQIRPYFSGEIVLTSSALADRPVTGVYNLADPVEALRGVARAQGATVRRITPWILLVSGR